MSRRAENTPTRADLNRTVKDLDELRDEVDSLRKARKEETAKTDEATPTLTGLASKLAIGLHREETADDARQARSTDEALRHLSDLVEHQEVGPHGHAEELAELELSGHVRLERDGRLHATRPL